MRSYSIRGSQRASASVSGPQYSRFSQRGNSNRISHRSSFRNSLRSSRRSSQRSSQSEDELSQHSEEEEEFALFGGDDGDSDYQLVPDNDQPFVPGARSSQRRRKLGSLPGDTNRVVFYFRKLMRDMKFQIATVVIIGLNAMCIGLETDFPNFPFWNDIEWLFMIFFAAELAMRITVIGAFRFFTCTTKDDPLWNIFDFLLVLLGLSSALVSYVMPQQLFEKADPTLFRVIRLFRILRILRVVRVFRFLKQLYLLAYGFVEAGLAVFWVTVLASSMMWCCAVVLVRVYGSYKDTDPFIENHFSNIPEAMFTLFEIMASPTLNSYKNALYEYPVLLVFIIIYVIFGSFGINGLLTGVISESILDKNQARTDEQRVEREARRRNLYKDSSDLFDHMDVDNNGALPIDEIMKSKEQILELFKISGIRFLSHDFDHMFDIMDCDDNGLIERTEFINGIVEMCDEIRPMSIMELNSLVSRCLSKIGRCELKVDATMRTVEGLAFNRRQSSSQAGTGGADDLVEALRDLLDGYDGGGARTSTAFGVTRTSTFGATRTSGFGPTRTSFAAPRTSFGEQSAEESQGTAGTIQKRDSRQGSRMESSEAGVASQLPRLSSTSEGPADSSTREAADTSSTPPDVIVREKTETFDFRPDLAMDVSLNAESERLLSTPPNLPAPVVLPGTDDAGGVLFAPTAMSMKHDGGEAGKPGSSGGLPRDVSHTVASRDVSRTGASREHSRSAASKDLNHVAMSRDVSRAASILSQAESERSQVLPLAVQALTSTASQVCLESCQQLVHEAMHHVDALAQIQRALESTKGETVAEACESVRKAIESLATKEIWLENDKQPVR